MEEPQGQNRFFERCARDASGTERMNWSGISISKPLSGSTGDRYGISVEDLRKRVNTLATEGNTGRAAACSQRKVRKSVKHRRRNLHLIQAQKLMLTWLVTYPEIFDKVSTVSDTGGFCGSFVSGKWQKCFLHSRRRRRCESGTDC